MNWTAPLCDDKREDLMNDLYFDFTDVLASTRGSVEAFFWTDFDGNVTSWPATAGDLLGWSGADAVGQPPPFIGARSAEVWRHALQCVKAGASVRHLDMTAITAQGHAMSVRLSCGPQRGASFENRPVLHIVWKIK